jgi:hypothetical protein
MSRLVHPKLISILQIDFFPQRCALKKPVKSQSTTGKQNITYVVEPGYEALPCRVAPPSGGERRGDRYTHLDATHAIAIPGQFADLTEEWVAVVDGQQYQILLIGKDAEGVMTHLETRIAK